LLIDEFGFGHIERQQSPQAANLLFKLIDTRGPQRSTALATNIDFAAWKTYLADTFVASAFLDRVVESAIILNINGKSYRAHHTAASRSGRSRSAKPPHELASFLTPLLLALLSRGQPNRPLIQADVLAYFLTDTDTHDRMCL
jgi:hypothetical protein